MNNWWQIVLAVAIVENVIAFAIAAAKGYTFGKTLRLMVWAELHPWKAVSGELPEEFR